MVRKAIKRALPLISEFGTLLLGMGTSLRILVVCHCYRHKDEVVRIISARKAGRDEQAQYRWWLK